MDNADSAFVQDARRGDIRAFRSLVEKSQRRLYALALGIVRSKEDAEDIVQEALVRGWKSLDSFDGRSQFSTWMHRIVVNLCIDHLRRRRLETVSLDEHRCAAVDPRRQLDGSGMSGRIARALDQLSPAHRAVLTLRELEGLSYKEISDTVGCSLGTVMSRLFHARRRMQMLLSDDARDLALAA
jgi:RNA polymerase sigma-70 factor (ECF subfamily)